MKHVVAAVTAAGLVGAGTADAQDVPVPTPPLGATGPTAATGPSGATGAATPGVPSGPTGAADAAHAEAGSLAHESARAERDAARALARALVQEEHGRHVAGAARDRALARAQRAARRAAAAADAAQKAAAERAGQAALDAVLLPSSAAGRPIPSFVIEHFRIPPFLLSIYQAAGAQYGVRWEVLAAINEIETDYGRNLNVSSAGARGWMQFMPATWRRYGVDANQDGRRDSYNPVDAIFGAARYLKAAGYADDVRGAIFAYNHDPAYVASVLARAKLVSLLPGGLVDSLTGLTEGRFPVAARATYPTRVTPASLTRKGGRRALTSEGSELRSELDVRAARGSAVVAVQDGRIVRIARSRALGRYVQLRDVYGTTYTYAHLGSVAKTFLVPRADAKLEAPRAAEREATTAAPAATRTPAARPAATPVPAGPWQRPLRPTWSVLGSRAAASAATAPAASAAGPPPGAVPSRADTRARTAAPTRSVYTPYQHRLLGGVKRRDLRTHRLRVGAAVVGGTILGRLGGGEQPHLRFRIRPAGEGAPLVDPTPILDGWRLLDATAIYRAPGRSALGTGAATIGQLLLETKDVLARRVLADRGIRLYPCGRRDVTARQVDRRVLATLAVLSAAGLHPTVSSLRCGHGLMTASGNVSEHSTGTAVDISAINGIPIAGHQGAGSITERTIRRLLTLQGTMKPHQIISLMTFPDADNTLSLPDHADHIHVGFRAGTAQGSAVIDGGLRASDWDELMARLNVIENPLVRVPGR